MNGTLFYTAGDTKALTFAANALRMRGICVSDRPSQAVTHLLLPVPSFEPDGRIKGGADPIHILSALPESLTVIGGNLSHPALDGYRRMDLLQDPVYLAENAAITADCALRVAGKHLNVAFDGCPILIIGWGRIGKCLAQKLAVLGGDVCVAARKEHDRAMLTALGFRTEDPATLQESLMRYRVIFNTAPELVLSEPQVRHCRADCVKIDLASCQGIAGSGVIWARGLPNLMLPESSGALIAKTMIRLLAKEEKP